MTATVAKIPDPLTVLTRAERKATGEEPGDLGHLAEAVRTQIIMPLTAGGTPVVDDVRVKQLLADKQRLDDLVIELRKMAETRGNVIERQTREIAELKKSASELKQHLATANSDTQRRIDAAVGAVTESWATRGDEVDKLRHAMKLRTTELDEARAERDTLAAQLRDKPAAPDLAAVGQLQTENAELADQLAQAQEQLATTRRDLELANRTLDEIADEEPAAAHVHHYPVPGPGEEARPCVCGQPYPRSYADAEFEEVVPDVEPWGDLFGRIRDQVAEAGWTA